MIYIKRSINVFLIIALFVSLFFTTIVYSAFNTQLQIRGEAIAKSDQIFRITDLKLTEATNGAYANYNSKFEKDTTSLYVVLPASSKMIYEVTVTNKDTQFMYILEEILPLINNNTNVSIKYSIKKGDCVNINEAKSFTITLTNNTSSEQSLTLINQYRFEPDTWKPLETEFLSSYDTGDLSADKDGVVFEFSVKNTNLCSVNYSITSDNPNFLISDEVTNNNTFQIDPNTTVTHRVRIKQRDDVAFENFSENLKLKVKSSSPVVSTTDVKTVVLKLPRDFSTVILNSYPVEKSPENFSDVETTDGHLYKDNDMDSSSYTYYFRGVIDKNYFQFADKLWRIVRVDSSGNIRVVLNDNVTPETQFNPDYISGSVENLEAAMPLVDYKQSNVRNVVEDWYDQNIAKKDASKYVINSKFCVDLSYQDPFETQYDRLVYYFTPYLHVGVDSNNFTPDFSCSKEYVFTSPVGLLSAEEVLAAGGHWEKPNRDYYLFNPNIPDANQTSWTLSASYYSIHEKQAGVIVFNQDGKGIFDWVIGGNIGLNYGYRPVITINGRTNISGDGTIDNPFQISE